MTINILLQNSYFKTLLQNVRDKFLQSKAVSLTSSVFGAIWQFRIGI